MLDKIKSDYGVYLLEIPLHTRENLLTLEMERQVNNLDEEQLLTNRLHRAGLVSLIPPKKSSSKDGGVDFALKIEKQIIIGQLKWWRKPIGMKKVKEIFGSMYFSDVALNNSTLKIDYILLAPLISRNTRLFEHKFTSKNYRLIHGSNFVQFMTNPYYYLTNRMEVGSKW